MLLEHFCQGQLRGQRVFDGKPFYTIVERGRDLNIEFRGDAHHLPEMPAISTKPNGGNSLRFKRIAMLVEVMEDARQVKDVVED